MRIVVAVKFVADEPDPFWVRPEQPASTGGHLSALDEYAVEEAARLRETRGAHVTLITMGPAGAAQALGKALAIGADRAVHVDDPAIVGSDAVSTSLVLASAIEHVGDVDLVLTGMSSTDGGMGVMAAMLSERLGWPQLTLADSLVLEDGRARVQRVTTEAEEVLLAELPAVVSVTDRINEPRYPTFREILAARQRPIDSLTLADLGIPAEVMGAAGARVRVTRSEAQPVARPGLVVVDDGPAGGVLAQYLVDSGLLGLGTGAGTGVGAVEDMNQGLPDEEGEGPTAHSAESAERESEPESSVHPGERYVVVLGQQVDGRARRSTLERLTLAARLGRPVALMIGPESPTACAELARHGAERVWTIDPWAAADGGAVSPVATVVAVLADLMSRLDPVALLTSSMPLGKEVAARLAVRLDAALVTDAVDVHAGPEGGVRTTQAIYNGRSGERYEVHTAARVGPAVVSVGPRAVDPVERPVALRVERLGEAAVQAGRSAAIVARVPHPGTGRPELTEATIVVAAGRGTHGELGPIEEFADEVGAAVAVSRPVVDAGWYSQRLQVGSTGRKVAPRLYVACGISGAAQHLAGMRSSDHLVVVNSDADAPIFAAASLGIVGDLFTVLPAATAALRAHRTRQD